MNYKLFADGINDDYPAIQEMLDSRVSEVYLPATDKCYRISKTLKIHSGQTLRMNDKNRRRCNGKKYDAL